MSKRDAEVRITGDTTDVQQSIKDLETFSKRTFEQMAEDAKKEADEVSDAFKKSGIRMEKDIKKSSEDARKRYRKIRDSGVASSNDIRRAHNEMTKKIHKNNRELGKSGTKIIDMFNKLKRGIVTATIAAVGFFGIKAINEAIKFETALIDLQKVMKDGEGNAADYTAQVEEMSKTFGDSSAEILQGVAIFKQAGFAIKDSFLLQEQAMKLAAASELEVAEASELITSALKGFKAPATDVVRLTDTLNAVSNKYATNLRELAIGVAELSPIAKKMGFSFEETAGLLTPVIEVFRSGSEASQALKTGLLKLIDDAQPVQDAMAKMGLSQQDYNDQLRSGKDILNDVSARFETLDENQKLAITSQLVGIRQTAKMVEVFDQMGLVLEVTNEGLRSTGSINREVSKVLAGTERHGKRAAQSFNILAKSIGELLLPVWNKLLDVAIPTMDAITKGIRGMSAAIKALPDIGGFLVNPFSVFGSFGQSTEALKDVNAEAKELNKTGKESVEVNKAQADSVEKVKEALIDIEEVRRKENQLIIDNRDKAIEAYKAIADSQKAQNESIKQAIRETKAELRELEQEADRASKFAKRILDEIAGSEKRIAQAGLDPLEKMVDDLARAEEDFKLAAKERAAGNMDAARELTLSAVQAANAILEVKKDADQASQVTGSELDKATREAEKLVSHAKNFALSMQEAADQAIPAVVQELSKLEGDLQLGKDTLRGIKVDIAEAMKAAVELKRKLNENTSATHTQNIRRVEAKKDGGEVMGFNRGGRVPGGWGGGDKVRAILEPGEHVIKKESVAKIGRQAAMAFNAGDVAGLLAALPPQQAFKDGGEVRSEGTTNVNLLMGDKAFPVTAKTSVAEEFLSEIKNINIIRGRKENIY